MLVKEHGRQVLRQSEVEVPSRGASRKRARRDEVEGLDVLEEGLAVLVNIDARIYGEGEKEEKAR